MDPFKIKKGLGRGLSSLIGDEKISDINFSHSVSKQVIFLIGIAQDNDELDLVIHHARTVKGVKKVISHIMLVNDKKRI